MASEQKTLWINKTAASKNLGRSEGAEKARIFSHVQRTVHNLAAPGQSRRVLSGSRNLISGSRYQTSSYMPDGAQTQSIAGLQHFPLPQTEGSSYNAIRLPSSNENSGTQNLLTAEGEAIITSQSLPLYRHDPSCRIFEPCHSRDSLQELNFLQFFHKMTAVEWSGWHDKHFWHHIAPQLAASHPVIRHALVSLGAFHASFKERERSIYDSYRALSLKQASKSIACFNRDHGSMTMPAVFISSIVLTAMASCIDSFTFHQTMKVEFDLLDHFRSQANQGMSKISRSDRHFIAEYLEPLIERQRSREGKLLDPIYALSVAPAAQFYISQVPDIPDNFYSLWQARDTLENMLKWITYNVKTKSLRTNEIPAVGEALVHRWLKAIQNFRQDHSLSDEHMCSWYALRASCKMAIVMIKTMHAHSEMVFDRYLDEFRELLAAFSRVLEHNKRTSQTNVRFGIDSGFVSLVTLAARCCRDPSLRRQLIASLVSAHRTEGGESAYVAATLLQCYQKIEEEGIEPPPTSGDDIRGESRIRQFMVSFYCKTKALRVQFLRSPYDPGRDVEEVWIPHVEDGTQILYAAVPERTGLQPDFCLGRGFASYLINDKASEYYTVEQFRFYFSIPRV